MVTKLYYFSAPWCGPCRVFGPVINKVAAELGVDVIKVNIDEDASVGYENNILSIPTLVDRDNPTNRVIGRVTEEHLRSWLLQEITGDA